MIVNLFPEGFVTDNLLSCLYLNQFSLETISVADKMSLGLGLEILMKCVSTVHVSYQERRRRLAKARIFFYLLVLGRAYPTIIGPPRK